MKKRVLILPVVILSMIVVVLLLKNVGTLNDEGDLQRMPGYSLYEEENAKYKAKASGYTNSIYYESIFVEGESTAEERIQVAEYIECMINSPWDENIGLEATQLNLSFYAEKDGSLIENLVFKDGEKQELTEQDVFYSADKRNVGDGAEK